MNKIYFVKFDYFATGEGLHTVLAAVIKESEEAAIKDVLTRTILKSGPAERFQESYDYFKVFASAYDLNTELGLIEAKKELNSVLKPETVAYLLDMNRQGGLFEFNFNFYVNLS